MNRNSSSEKSKLGNSFSGKLSEIFLRIICGAIVGVGALLPGVSGGVLCVIFGVYTPIIETLSHPLQTIKKNMKLLLPVFFGIAVGFLGISKLLGFLLEAYPYPSICFFVGLIAGMLPSLYKEAGEKGRNKNSFVAMFVSALFVVSLIIGIKAVSFEIIPNIPWYLFCGFCMAISLIVPGMSFSTLLMPLGLYTPLVDGIGTLNFEVLIPAGIGAVLTLLLLARAIEALMKHFYSIVFHAIIGVVVAATAVIIPFGSFLEGFVACIANCICIAVGAILAFLLENLNQKVKNKSNN